MDIFSANMGEVYTGAFDALPDEFKKSTTNEQPKTKNKVAPSVENTDLLCFGGKWYRWEVGRGWKELPTNDFRALCAQKLKADGKQYRTLDVSNKMDEILGGNSLLIDHDATEISLTKDGKGLMQGVPVSGWLATRSHLINMDTGETRPATPEIFVRGCVPCNYDPKATCPRWEAFLEDTVEAEERGLLKKMFGLSLTYNRRYNVFFVIYGEAGTGKSTCLNVLAKLNCGNLCSVSLADFGGKFETYDLTENRLNLVPDMSSICEGEGNVRSRESILKATCCMESIQVQRKGVDPVRRQLTALTVFGCNEIPRFADKSNAISDRMRVILFNHVFRNTEKQDIKLGEKLLSELPGILNWSIEGYRELIDSSCKTFPESVAGEKIKSSSIRLARPEEAFFDERLEKNEDAQTSSQDIYSVYQCWCAQNGYKRPLQSNQFMERLLKYFPEAMKKEAKLSGVRKTWVFGIKVIPNAPN